MDKATAIVFKAELDRLIQEAQQGEPSRTAPPVEQDWVFETVLAHPSITNENILREFERFYHHRPNFQIRRLLYQYYLNMADGRKACIDQAAQLNTSLHVLLSDASPEEWTTAYKNYRDSMRHRMLNAHVAARMALRSLSREWRRKTSDPLAVEAGDTIVKLLSVLRPDVSRQAFMDLMDRLAEERGLRKKLNSKQNVEELLETVEALTHEIETGEDGEGAPGRDGREEEMPTARPRAFEKLEEENASMRGSLLGLAQELKNLKERITELEENAQTEGAINFLGEMNSSTHGMLLDNLYQSGILLSRLIEDGWVPPAEIESVPYLLKMFAEFLDQIGVEKLKEKGARECLTLNNLPDVNYLGSEFKDAEDSKTVEYRSPGWRYRGIVFSRPQAVEIRNS